MDTSNKNAKTKQVHVVDVKVMPKIEKKAWLDESIADHFNCVLCGSTLMFTHKTDFANHTVSEKAHCPSCGVKNRESSHSLQ